MEEVKLEIDSAQKASAPPPAAPAKRHWWSWKLQPRAPTSGSSDPEKGGKRQARKQVLLGPIYAGIGAALSACTYLSFLLPAFFSILFAFSSSCNALDADYAVSSFL